MGCRVMCVCVGGGGWDKGISVPPTCVVTNRLYWCTSSLFDSSQIDCCRVGFVVLLCC